MKEKDWKTELARRFPEAKWEEPMRRHTTFRIGGPAECYLELRAASQMEPFFSILKRHDIPCFMLGWGSNLLVRDGGMRGVVLRLRGEFEKVRRLEGPRIWAGSGVRLPKLVTFCAEHDLSGSEPLVGVPGTVGGALVMNAGTREGEIGPLVREVDAFDVPTLSSIKLPASGISFRYRGSDLEGRILLGATLELKAGSKVDIIRRVQALQRKRSETQPIHTYNVGSVFKNPSGRFAAELVQESGLKGAPLGGARISPLHANFIENHDHATAADVLALVERARGAVRKRFGVELELEMKVVGDEPAGV